MGEGMSIEEIKELLQPRHWLDTSQAADYLGVSTRTIRRWCDARAIRYGLDPTGRFRFKPEWLDQAIEVKKPIGN